MMVISMKNLIYISLVSVLTLTACNSTKDIAADKSEEKASSTNTQNNNASAIYWQQSSAEYKALCYQAFNIATDNLADFEKKSASNSGDITTNSLKPKAIIMDLDETVIDNSPYHGYLFKNNLNYEYVTWKSWTQRGKTKLIPGAKEFIGKARQMNIPIFYISNRTEEMMAYTIQNLAEQGVELDPQKVLLLKRQDNGKIERRRSVLSSFDVFMLIGDNLADFNDVFELAPDREQRKTVLEGFQKEFGRKFILIPNLMYGDWMPTEENETDPNRTQPVRDLAPYINSYD